MHVTDTDNFVYKLPINKKNYVYKYQSPDLSEPKPNIIQIEMKNANMELRTSRKPTLYNAYGDLNPDFSEPKL